MGSKPPLGWLAGFESSWEGSMSEPGRHSPAAPAPPPPDPPVPPKPPAPPDHAAAPGAERE